LNIFENLQALPIVKVSKDFFG
jgi:hypothetical protein